MPKLGEVKSGREIGKKAAYKRFVWHACEICGNERWVMLLRGLPRSKVCEKCQGKRSHPGGDKQWSWKGGRLEQAGYIYVWVSKEDFFSPMRTRKGYVFEHRLVMAKHLGRNLHPWEVVHHKNHIKDDNRIENLQLYSDVHHNQFTILTNKIQKLESIIQRLKEEINQLRVKGC